MSEEKKITKEKEAEEEVKFKGKFIAAVGRRKSSVAQVRLYSNGKGVIVVNDKNINDYFPAYIVPVVSQPLKQAGLQKDLNFTIKIAGGGVNGQAEAARHGISRALVKLNAELKPALKPKGFLKRDARRKERKKPGLKKARRAPQWSKR